MPRYVLLRHELPPDSGRASHWDLMLEHEGVLWTWELERLPQLWRQQLRLSICDAGNEVHARRLSDHRLPYLDYEGEVSDGRGQVTQVAAGSYSVQVSNNDAMQIQLTGTLQGSATLTSCRASASEWILIAESDGT